YNSWLMENEKYSTSIIPIGDGIALSIKNYTVKGSMYKMSEENSLYMTEEGKEKLEEELHNLKMVKRKEVVERIKIARYFGDLSENSEYDSEKEEQSFVETRIAQVEKMIRYAVIIESDTASDGIVDLGKTVTFKELPDGDEETYKIVGIAEADP